jgi:hypothetical protein
MLMRARRQHNLAFELLGALASASVKIQTIITSFYKYFIVNYKYVRIKIRQDNELTRSLARFRLRAR